MNTKHNATCHMSFGRPHPETGCPRCIELAAGAPPRSWNARSRYGYQTTEQRSAEIAAHLAPDRQIVAQADTSAAALDLLRRAERQPSLVAIPCVTENPIMKKRTDYVLVDRTHAYWPYVLPFRTTCAKRGYPTALAAFNRSIQVARHYAATGLSGGPDLRVVERQHGSQTR